MGEAKRRKELGLMPCMFPFQADISLDGQITLLTKTPYDHLIREKLEQTCLTHEGWASEYRSAAVFAGQIARRLETAADVSLIAVPSFRRISGEYVAGKQTSTDGIILPLEEGSLVIRTQSHSFDAKKWQQFPKIKSERIKEALDRHPAFHLQGELLGQFRVDQWREGRIDTSPEPPHGTLEILEEVAREWHGKSDEQWNQLHTEQLPNGTTAAAKRTYFEMRSSAPLQNPLRNALVRGSVEIYPLTGGSYSPDGSLWIRYDDPSATPQETDFFGIFNQILNIETVQVTVYADGRIDTADLEEDIAARVRRDVQQGTGAGTPAWNDWAFHVLEDTFQTRKLPVPVAVRLDLPVDALQDPETLAGVWVESEVSFDETNWYDLYDEELPEELLQP